MRYSKLMITLAGFEGAESIRFKGSNKPQGSTTGNNFNVEKVQQRKVSFLQRSKNPNFQPTEKDKALGQKYGFPVVRKVAYNPISPGGTYAIDGLEEMKTLDGLINDKDGTIELDDQFKFRTNIELLAKDGKDHPENAIRMFVYSIIKQLAEGIDKNHKFAVYLLTCLTAIKDFGLRKQLGPEYFDLPWLVSQVTASLLNSVFGDLMRAMYENKSNDVKEWNLEEIQNVLDQIQDSKLESELTNESEHNFDSLNVEKNRKMLLARFKILAGRKEQFGKFSTDFILDLARSVISSESGSPKAMSLFQCLGALNKNDIGLELQRVLIHVGRTTITV